MTRIRRHRIRALVLLAALAAIGIVAVANAGTKVTLKAGHVEATFEGGVSPTALPKKGTAPVGLTLNGEFKDTSPPEHLPAVEQITLHFDKAGVLETKGLPSCKASEIEATTTAGAKKACKPALVGTGNVHAEIELREQPPFKAQGPLLVFNASHGAKQELLLHVYAHVPAATTFVVPVKISKDHGKFGTKAFIQVPKIVGGTGSVTSFKASIKKLFTDKGKKASLLNAGCPTGSLAVLGEFSFHGGTSMEGELKVPCKPKG